MQPRNAIVTIHHIRHVPDSMGADGNTPNYREVTETKQVRAKVWPVSMGSDELLVEYEDGTFGTVKLQDIRVGIMGNKCPHCNPDELLPIRECGPNSIRLIHERGTWHIATNIELSDGSFLQNGKEVRRVQFAEPVSFCPKCGRKLV